ncbi:MAG: Threonine--tRNA ligase [Chlamydiae bacterium]|nr:Threonine--tRNA ligase [Chlamydiota bacterium]
MDESNNHLAHLGGSFSKLLAHAVLDIFPGTQLFQDWVKQSHFCCQFILKNKIDSLDLNLIGDRISQIQNSDLKIHQMEMVPQNAMELFRAQNQRQIEYFLKKCLEPTVSVVKINHFYDLNRWGVLLNLEKKCFKLHSYEIFEKGKNTYLNISGVVADHNQDLKGLLKAHKALKKNSHELLGQDLGLFKGELFLPDGVKLLNCLKNEIQNKFEENNFKEIKLQDSTSNLKKSLLNSELISLGSKYFLWDQHHKKNNNPLESGLFQIKTHTCDHWISVVNRKSIQDECISYLNFYRQIIKILGFSYRVKCGGGLCPKLREVIEHSFKKTEIQAEFAESKHLEVSFEILDCYKRVIIEPLLKIERSPEEGENNFVIEGTFCSSIEMLLAQVVEHYQGELPQKWRKLQLKILSLEKGKDFAVELYDYFEKNNIAVTMDTSTQKLGAKLHSACREKVPFVAIVGEKEQNEKKLTVKMQQSNREIRCSKEELLESLLKELKEREES